MPEPAFLYVEDDMLSREVMELLVVMVMGYSQFTIFEDSRDFLDRLKAMPYQPKVIFLDIQMKPLDGFELLAIIRAEPDYKDATVIALTANVMATDVDELKQAGFDGLIGKPIIDDAFPELLTRILNGESVWFVY